MPVEEVRGHPRLALVFEVEYSVLSGFDKLNLIQAKTVDFSESGAKIETGDKLAQKDMLSVRIELPDLKAFRDDEAGNRNYGKTVIMCFGTVRWTTPLEGGGCSAGIRFSGMAVSDRTYLKRLLQEDSILLKK
ncbi:MAG: PilZ domain-containing protein [Candidatus Glassbacteria bacterium]